MTVAMLDTLKLYLDITWDDEHTDQKLSGILARAEDYLNSFAGEELDFADGTAEQQLLLDRCRYVWNNASEDFETNYEADLLMLRAKYRVEGMEDGV